MCYLQIIIYLFIYLFFWALQIPWLFPWTCPVFHSLRFSGHFRNYFYFGGIFFTTLSSAYTIWCPPNACRSLWLTSSIYLTLSLLWHCSNQSTKHNLKFSMIYHDQQLNFMIFHAWKILSRFSMTWVNPKHIPFNSMISILSPSTSFPTNSMPFSSNCLTYFGLTFDLTQGNYSFWPKSPRQIKVTLCTTL